jgi:hypothetical protein
MSYNYRIGRSCTESAIGKEWTFGRFTRKIWIDLADEGRKLLPNPVKEALAIIDEVTLRDAEIIRKLKIADGQEIERAKAEHRQPVLMSDSYVSMSTEILDRAYKATGRYLSAGSPELIQFIGSQEGGSHLFYLLLREHHKDVTQDEAFDVYNDLALNNGADGRRTVAEIINICNGKSAEPLKNEGSPA